MSIFIAGHETTANALSWLWYLLSLHPDLERKLRVEVDEVLGGRPVAFGDLPKLKYVEAVFLETLRLYPPVWLFFRRASAADQIGNCRIPAGTTIFVCPYLSQRDPRYWADAAAFKPERFLGNLGGHTSRFEFFPFARGPRTCIGQHFATLEAATIIARVLQNFELARISPASAEMAPGVTLRPRKPILFQLRSRNLGQGRN
jgi:cytochrome P450